MDEFITAGVLAEELRFLEIEIRVLLEELMARDARWEETASRAIRCVKYAAAADGGCGIS